MFPRLALDPVVTSLSRTRSNIATRPAGENLRGLEMQGQHEKIAGERSMSKKAAEHHKKASQHHTHAARHHEEAAKHHEGGHHEKAAHHAHSASGHATHARHHAEEAGKAHVEEHGSK
jgi:hypothetical protein